jgi:pimeloyl-ACP methyl ester carboxylesterase
LNDGSELHYRARGDAAGGHALFVHPFMHDGTIWMEQMRALDDLRRCVAVDMRGHGKSDPNPSPAIIESEHLADLIELIETIPGPIDLVGLAFGGNMCALLAEERPERIRSLTMISSSFEGVADPATKRYSSEFGRLAAVQGKGVVYRRAMDYIFGPDAPLHAKARYRGIIERTPTETYVAFYCNAQFTPRPDLPGKLSMPVLIPYGDSDPGVNLSGPLGQIPNLTTERFEGASRLLPLEAPEKLNAALRKFWTNLK